MSPACVSSVFFFLLSLFSLLSLQHTYYYYRVSSWEVNGEGSGRFIVNYRVYFADSCVKFAVDSDEFNTTEFTAVK